MPKIRITSETEVGESIQLNDLQLNKCLDIGGGGGGAVTSGIARQAGFVDGRQRYMNKGRKGVTANKAYRILVYAVGHPIQNG